MEGDENSVTMLDVLKEQEDFEENAKAVLGASDDKNCTYAMGYIKRQALYACLTCCPESVDKPASRAGVCLACSLACHESHTLIELYTKRNFRCDCGGPNLKAKPCVFNGSKTDSNILNQYNQNFSGLYCVCHRPYPDPEDAVEDEMIQCIVCEDWLHSRHLDTKLPPSDQYSEMICQKCMENNEFLNDYLCYEVSGGQESDHETSVDTSVTDNVPDNLLNNTTEDKGQNDKVDQVITPDQIQPENDAKDSELSDKNDLATNDLSGTTPVDAESVQENANENSAPTNTQLESNINKDPEAEKTLDESLTINDDIKIVAESNADESMETENLEQANISNDQFAPEVGKESGEDEPKQDIPDPTTSPPLDIDENLMDVEEKFEDKQEVSDLANLAESTVQEQSVGDKLDPNVDVNMENVEEAVNQEVGEKIDVNNEIIEKVDNSVDKIIQDPITDNLNSETTDVVNNIPDDISTHVAPIENMDVTENEVADNVNTENIEKADVKIGNDSDENDMINSIITEENETINRPSEPEVNADATGNIDDSSEKIVDTQVLNEIEKVISETIEQQQVENVAKVEATDDPSESAETLTTEDDKSLNNDKEDVPIPATNEDDSSNVCVKDAVEDPIEQVENVAKVETAENASDDVIDDKAFNEDNLNICVKEVIDETIEQVEKTPDVIIPEDASENSIKDKIMNAKSNVDDTGNSDVASNGDDAAPQIFESEGAESNLSKIDPQESETAEISKSGDVPSSHSIDNELKPSESEIMNVTCEKVAESERSDKMETNENTDINLQAAVENITDVSEKCDNESGESSQIHDQTDSAGASTKCAAKISVASEETDHTAEMNECQRKKRKLDADCVNSNGIAKKIKIKEEVTLQVCIKPVSCERIKRKGAAFWPSDWRTKLCSCVGCLNIYSEKKVHFLLDIEDTVSAYEDLGKIKTEASSSQYEKGMEALSSLGHVQQINAITEYNKMKEKLLDFLKTFKDKREVVKEEDIKGFFAGMKPKREPDGIYFCK